MEKFIIIQNEEVELKNIYVSDAGIKTLDKNLETKESFLKSFESTSNATLDSKDDILYSTITSISTFNDDFGIQIIYTKRNGKSETCYLEIEHADDQQEVKDFILSKTKLKPTDVESKNKRSTNKYCFSSISYTIDGVFVYIYGNAKMDVHRLCSNNNWFTFLGKNDPNKICLRGRKICEIIFTTYI